MGPFPLIVFSHGAHGSKDNYLPLTEHLASHGYLTIQPTHSDSLALGMKLRDPVAFRDWPSRPADVSFILDSLAELERVEPALKGKFDRQRIGVGGHSFGANTAQLIGGAKTTAASGGKSFEDKRVAAVLLLSGQGPGEMLTEKSWEQFARPMLVMTGSRDGPTRTGQPAEWRKKPYELSPPGDKFLAWVEGLDHGYGGIPGVSFNPSHKANPDHVAWTKMITLAFWDAYLKTNQEARAYLESDKLFVLSKGMIKMEHKQAPRVATGKLMSHAMQNARLFLAAVVFALWPDAGWAQAKPGQIDAILSRVPGNTWTALVENDSGSVTYYQHDADLGFAPASNTKLFTTAAAFGLLGSNYVFATRIYCDGPLTHGVLHGNLNLVCEHDPTWNSSVFTNARVPLNHIAARLKALGLTSVGSNVQCYGVCAYNFFTTNNLSATTRQVRNAAAAAAFAEALKAQGITVSGKAVGQTGFSTPGRLFYTHHSSDLAYQGSPLRLDIACIPLLKTSHNVMADLLCRHLGWKLAGRDTYLAGSAQVLGWLKETADLGTNGMVMNDGSGFSRSNRFSARQCVSLVRYMLAAFPTWEAGLPVGGVDGTIRRRFLGTDGAGQVHAKTGSAPLAIALSGYFINPYDRQRYLFSFIGNRTNIDQTATRQAIDDSVARFCGPPASK